jgi:hypothetical protein
VGKTYLFECSHCLYRAKVSGGADGGVDCEIQTVRCRECRELMDVFTRVRRRMDAGDADGVKFPGFFRPEIPPLVLRDGKAGKLVWKKFELSCPVSAKHFVESWNNPGRCPRCGAFMEQNGFPFRVWD